MVQTIMYLLYVQT